MAKPTKRKVPGGVEHSGRVTTKGPSSASSADGPGRPRPPASSRYTPPVPSSAKLGSSGRWVPITLFTLLVVGVLMIIINYMSVLLPGAPSNWYIVGGLGLILAGIMVATQWR
ncbi:MAG: hypothetical protein QOJ19_224 [Acidimicrobiia bacterium]|jgi:hypothetical protein|nr:hypothetical protein [Acidimicrobiia bacterium]